MHTPGPWRIEDDEITAADNTVLGIIFTGWPDNARLMAAAPELLASCKELLPYFMACSIGNEHDLIIIRAMAAIAKAERQ